MNEPHHAGVANEMMGCGWDEAMAEHVAWFKSAPVPAEDRVPRSGVRALRSTRLPAGRAGTFRLPRWAA